MRKRKGILTSIIAFILLLSAGVYLSLPTTSSSSPNEEVSFVLTSDALYSPVREVIVEKLKTQDRVKLDLFVMSQCPYGVSAEKALIPVVQEFGEWIDFTLYFIADEDENGGFVSLHGSAEVAEDIRQVVMATYYPEKYLDYVLARANNYQSDEWEQHAIDAGINPERVRKIASGREGVLLFQENIKIGKDLRISASPTIQINDERYRGKLFPLASDMPACSGSLTGAPCIKVLICAARDGCNRRTVTCIGAGNRNGCGVICGCKDGIPNDTCLTARCTSTEKCDNGTCKPMPVELISFEATAIVDGNVLLSWETASETNNKGFEVQHATSNTPFEALTFVEGHGTTHEPQHYAYQVSTLAPGTHTFRLKQLDFDGAFEYSPEVEVLIHLPGTYTLSAPYPNPVKNEARFTLSVAQRQHVKVEVFDLLGRSVAVLHDGVVEANSVHRLLFDAGGLPSGTYLYRATGEYFVSASRQIVVVK